MNWLINQLAKIRLLKGDFDYYLVRASMVIIYFFFGYQKWFDYDLAHGNRASPIQYEKIT
jgi:uncharacterized membrane protein YkgB